MVQQVVHESRRVDCRRKGREVLGEETCESLVIAEEPAQVKYGNFHCCLFQLLTSCLRLDIFLQSLCFKVRSLEQKCQQFSVFWHFYLLHFAGARFLEKAVVEAVRELRCKVGEDFLEVTLAEEMRHD